MSPVVLQERAHCSCCVHVGRGASSPQNEILSPDANHVSFSALEAAVCFRADRQYAEVCPAEVLVPHLAADRC